MTGKIPSGIALKAPGWGSGKQRRFVLSYRTCSYHVLSRVAGGELLFGEIEKEAFRKLMRRKERFSGVEVVTYAVMWNHFRLLLRVPERAVFLRKFEKGTKGELLRCRVRYFSDGLLLGSRDFVEKAFQEKREWFGPERKSGARGLPVGGDALFVLRDLKVRALE